MRLRDDQDGQGMAEFGLVLPLLALITFGTIEVSLYLQQQSTLNAAAFIAARSACVLDNQITPTKASVQKFASDAGASWLQQAVSTMKGTPTDEHSRYALVAKTDRLSGMIDALTNGQAKGFDTLAAETTMPLEYEYKKFDQKTPTSLQRTMYMFSYQSEKWQAMLPSPIELAPKNFGLVRDPSRPLLAGLPFTPPTPKPTPKPAAPTGDTPGGPKVIEVPQTHPSTNAGPAPKLGKLTFKVPRLEEVFLFNPAETEPFRQVGAVVHNPHHRRDAGDSDSTSSEYLAPGYEKNVRATGPGLFGKDPKYKIQNLLDELQKFEDELKAPKGGASGAGVLFDACTVVGHVDVNHVPRPLLAPLGPLATDPAVIIAADKAWKGWVGTKLTQTKHNASTYAKGIVDGTQKAYDMQLKQEKELYKP